LLALNQDNVSKWELHIYPHTVVDQLREYESNYQHMKNQQENVQMELEQSKLQCTQLTSELGKSHFNHFCYLEISRWIYAKFWIWMHYLSG
jgi:hypothetical protein